MDRLKIALNKLAKVAGKTATFVCNGTNIDIKILQDMPSYDGLGLEENFFITADDSWLEIYNSDKNSSRFIIDGKTHKIFDVVSIKGGLKVKIDDGN